jgi:hypothetical protein
MARMMRSTRMVLGLLLLGACSSAAPTNGKTAPTGGSGGDGSEPTATGGSVERPPTGGSGGSVVPADAAPEPGTGGSTTEADAAVTSEADAAPSTGDGGGPQKATTGHAGSIAWYEAEDGTLFGRAVKSHCNACPSTAMMKAGDSCCSGGGEVTWIVAAKTSDLQLNGIVAPSDGTYDVTFWYYCGNNDNFNDRNCGGQTDPPTTAAGCRPHQFVVNGTLMPGAYHFPCFGGAWSIVRTATVAIPLKAGANTIRMHAPPPRDCVNLDGIELYPQSKGLPPLIKMNSDLTGH